ncbi:c-type cytochrome [Pseudooceanicola sp. CBS1P-1]|uniref:C-type cytochrome n=1 Tax=Pseudooceanicola albus TaxID=2692189 RepID=A0A6L7G6U2_9RHOB|nr:MULTISPECIES: di-heme oxidoredictase family protein [Pseudooceanicola]MBT9383089.1 c-type cytochrome [Pseudooceanicola endophyticus]MXN19277.1 c-type cytochrome [Pseudooceanicola albus]
MTPPAKPILTLLRLGACAVALAGPAAATDLAEPLDNILPRDKDEAARVAMVTRPTQDFSAPEKFEQNPAGAATTRARSDADAFSQSSGNMTFERELDFKVGNGLFKKIWVSAPSSTLASDGLGPLYNARACQRCHLKDGRGHPPEPGAPDNVSIFLRISVPAHGGAPLSDIEAFLQSRGETPARTRPDPVYGGQLQDFSLPGLPAEYRLGVTWQEVEVPMNGETAHLRRPDWEALELGYGPLADGAMLSPRVAPQMIGLGLLEAIPTEDILAHADPEDRDGDGISGRAQIVWSFEKGAPMLGRFGWKAGAPSVREQSAAAFAGDIGISTPIFRAPSGDCTTAQALCIAAPDGSDPDTGAEIDATGLDLVTFYSRNLAVPERRYVDAQDVLRGKRIFSEANCTGCHVPKFVTNRLDGQPEQSFQLIWPYTDLLLHDMGEGLADNRPEGRASGTEWKTPPLWGIGLTPQVNGHSYYLHDGRARSLLEAVLWHGGEAAAARDHVVALEPEDRAALIAFLESL